MRPDLPEVTLVAVSSIALDATAEALSRSLDRANFGCALLLSDRLPSRPLDERIEWRKIPPLRSRSDYSAFMLHDLHKQIGTGHALCIQWDGYVLNGAAWEPEYLEFDYIGAVWPHFDDGHRVGNGGFSLRSRRLLEEVSQLHYDRTAAEDIVIARHWRTQLEAKGLRFAPEEVARRFAYERGTPSGREFGFHGAFNLVKLRSPKEVFTLVKSLEPQVLNRNEHFELLRWALRRGYPKIASLLVRRIMRQ